MPYEEEDAARQALQRAVEISGLPLRRCGFVPSASQKEEIQTIVDDLGTNIQAVDVEISRLQELRLGMTKQRAISQSIMSPIRVLPRELLSEIFEIVRCTTARPYLGRPPFASVCLEWRLTALGTPTLWTEFHVDQATRVHEQPTLMAQFLARSAALPLQVYLHALDSSARSAFLLLARLSQHRWGSLTLNTCGALEPLDCPMLSVVTVGIAFRVGRKDILDLMFLENARVRHLSLALDHLSVSLPPWPALSTLKLTMVRADKTEFSHANKVISSFRQTLENLVVADDGDNPINTVNSNRQRPVELPALVSIDLDNYTYAMMRTIIAPNLLSVTLRRCPAHDDLGEYVLADSGLMAMQSVRCLTLVYFEFVSLERLLEALDGLPNLEHINVVDRSSRGEGILSGNRFLRALADLGGNERPLRLPKLTSLSLFFRLMVGEAKDRERRQALAELMLARKANHVVDGVLVKGLKELTTNLSKEGWVE